MENYSIFFNNKFIVEHKSSNEMQSYEPISLSEKLLKAGDWCLSPVRCLFNGREVTIAEKPTTHQLRDTLFVASDFEYQQRDFEKDCSPKPRRSVGRMIAAIVLFIPGILAGGILKGLAYKSSDDVKDLHRKVSLHYTPIEKLVFGSKESPITFENFKKEFQKSCNDNIYGQSVNQFEGYASPSDKEKIEGFMFDLRTNAFVTIHPVKVPANSEANIQAPADA